MNKQRPHPITQNIKLLLASLIFCFFVIEIGYRLLDPFPYFSPSEINHTEHGNLSMYDATLGWRGVPSGETQFVTKNNSVWLAHNRQGFRDIEHDDLSEEKPAIVFLGDSFSWGYEVEFDEMFVNLLRGRFPSYEIFNLAHRGYGTDQALLTFKQWNDKRKLRLVVLMFSENDVIDNNSELRYEKSKPKFQNIDNQLILTGIPVPKHEDWASPPHSATANATWKKSLKRLVFRSHLLHDVYVRYQQLRYRGDSTTQARPKRTPEEVRVRTDLTLTARILEELRDHVVRQDSKLIVVFIPSKREIEELDDYLPYQLEVADMCEKLGIEHFDLAPMFKSTWYRTYFRFGRHWNSRGHELAAKALYKEFRTEGGPLAVAH